MGSFLLGFGRLRAGFGKGKGTFHVRLTAGQAFIQILHIKSAESDLPTVPMFLKVLASIGPCSTTDSMHTSGCCVFAELAHGMFILERLELTSKILEATEHRLWPAAMNFLSSVAYFCKYFRND